MSNVQNAGGWLPYGSSDPSVIIQHPLTSALTTNNMPFSTLIQRGSFSSIVHDAVKGMQPNGGSYDFQGFTGTFGAAALNRGGFQISLDIQREWVCLDAASVGSIGYTVGDECALAFSPGTSDSFQYWMIEKIGGNALTGRAFNVASQNKNYLDGTNQTMAPHSIGKPDYVTINLGFIGGAQGGKYIFAVDGQVLSQVACADTTLANLMSDLYIGSGIATRFMTTSWIRNLQIANRPPVFPAHPLLRSVVLWGDSKPVGTTYNDGVSYDAIMGWTFLRQLAKKGIYPGSFKVQSNSGYNFGTYTGTGASNLTSTLATLQATNPTVVLICAGTNDPIDGHYNNTEMRSSIGSAIDTMLGWASVQNIIIATVPTTKFLASSYSAQIEANRKQVSAYFSELALTRPKLIVVDSYTQLGGESPLPNTFIGQQDGLSDNLHFAAQGHVTQGVGYANAVFNLLK